MGALDGLSRLLARALELSAQLPELRLHLHHQLHAGQIQPRAGEVLDALELFDVAVAVAAAAPARAGGVQQSPPFVDAQRLRMHARELRGDGDDIETLLVCSHLRLPGDFSAIPWCSRPG